MLMLLDKISIIIGSERLSNSVTTNAYTRSVTQFVSTVCLTTDLWFIVVYMLTICVCFIRSSNWRLKIMRWQLVLS